MTRPLTEDIKSVLRIAISYNGTQFTASDLQREGASFNAVRRAVEQKYLARTAKRKKTGNRGRPGFILKVTPKGQRAAVR